MKKALRRLAQVTILFLAGGVTFCAYNFATAETRVRALCADIKPGMGLAELEAFAHDHGLGPRPHEGLSYVVEARTSGRWGCKVEVENGIVKSSEYNFAD